jgi:hypothetical protein
MPKARLPSALFVVLTCAVTALCPTGCADLRTGVGAGYLYRRSLASALPDTHGPAIEVSVLPSLPMAACPIGFGGTAALAENGESLGQLWLFIDLTELVDLMFYGIGETERAIAHARSGNSLVCQIKYGASFNDEAAKTGPVFGYTFGYGWGRETAEGHKALLTVEYVHDRDETYASQGLLVRYKVNFE